MDALVWTDDQGPQQLWVPAMPGARESDTAWTDGGPYGVPAAYVAARPAGMTWDAWAAELASGRLTGPGDGSFTVTQLPDPDGTRTIWQDLAQIRARFLAASFSRS